MVSMAGVGEGGGLPALEQVAVALKVKYGRDLGLRCEQLPALAQELGACLGEALPPSRPVVGELIFSHESGIHVAGIVANPVTYQPYPPALVGRSHQIAYGKHSGLNAVKYLLEKEQLQLSEDAQRELLNRIKDAGQRKAPPAHAEVAGWARELARRGSQAP